MAHTKKALIVRYGAIGDCIMITPVIQKLKDEGYYIVLNTGKRGKAVFEHDRRIDEFIMHDESMPLDALEKHWNDLKKRIKPSKYINFSQSIECNVALHPVNPQYIYPKYERNRLCNRNYYDVTTEWSQVPDCEKRPSLRFTLEEEELAKEIIDKDKFNILWCLSGSGKNKVYPWTDFVMGEILNHDKDVNIITVGDERCKLLENDNVMNLAGEISIRMSLCLTKFVDLVIAPDTGVLHAAGCYDTPKIGLLGHTTKENITKYFLNDFSVEADCACAPCHRLIYDIDVQCPRDCVTGAVWCMSHGIQPERIYEHYKRARDCSKNMPSM